MLNKTNQIFDYFIDVQKEIKNNNEENFITLAENRKSLYNGFISNPETAFFGHLCLINFIENVSETKIPVKDLIKHTYLTEIPALYKDTKNELNEHYEEDVEKLTKIISSTFPHLKYDELMRLSSYITVEALAELDKANITFLPKETASKEKSVLLFEDFSLFDSDIKAIDYVSNHKNGFGFYLVKVKSKYSLSNTSVGFEPILISHQGDGMTLIRFDSRRRNVIASRTITSLVFNNIITKEHKIKFSEKTDSTSLINIHNDEALEFYNSIYNQITLKMFTQIFVKNYAQYKGNEAVLLLNKTDEVESKDQTQFPVVAEYKNVLSQAFTFDDLRFSGKYDFLSFLDEIFEDIIDMDIVNYVSNVRDQVTLIRPRDKDDSYNNFNLKEFKHHDLPIDAHNWNSAIHSVTECSVGTEEESKALKRKIAMANKLSLYDHYIRKFYTDHIEELSEDLKTVFMEHHEAMLKDETLLRMARIGSCRSTESNRHAMFTNFCESICSPDAKGGEADHNTMREVGGKHKAHSVIVINFTNPEAIDYLKKHYNFKPSVNADKILKLEQSYYKLREIRKSEGHDVYSNLFTLFNFKMDIELYDWLNNCKNLLSTIVPVSKRRFDDFNSFAEEKNIQIKKPSYRGARIF